MYLLFAGFQSRKVSGQHMRHNRRGFFPEVDVRLLMHLLGWIKTSSFYGAWQYASLYKTLSDTDCSELRQVQQASRHGFQLELNTESQAQTWRGRLDFLRRSMLSLQWVSCSSDARHYFISIQTDLLEAYLALNLCEANPQELSTTRKPTHTCILR